MANDYDVLGGNSYQDQLEEARRKRLELANRITTPSTTTQPQATQSVTQPQMTGNIIKYKDQSGNFQDLDEIYEKTGQLPPGWTRATGMTAGVVSPQQTSISQLQQQIANAQKNRSVAALEQAYQRNVGTLNTERATIDPFYAGQTRQAVAQGEMRKKSFSDFLAEKGLSGSGLTGQGEIAQNVAMQGQLGDIQAKRGEAMTDIERRLTEAARTRDFGVADATSQAERDLAEQQLNEMLRQEGISREDRLRQEALARQEADRVRQAELDTIGRYSNDYTAEIQRRQATPDTSDDALIPYLETAAREKIVNINQNKAQTEQAQAKAQAEFEKAQYDRAMKIWEQTGVADANVSAIIGVPVGTMTSDRRYKDAQLALDKIKANKPSGSSDKLTLNQALTNARLILGNDATAQEVQTLAAQLQGGTGIQLTTPTDKPKVTPPSKKTPTPAKDTLDWLYKLRRESDLVSIGNFMNDPGNIKELNSIISNPTSTDDEIAYAEQILKDYKQYSTGNYITGR